MPSLNTGNAILSNAITVDGSYNVGIGGAASGSYKLQVSGTTNLTGALTVGTNLTVGNVLYGNSAQFSNSLTGSAYFLNGMTAGSGALYWTSDIVSLANNNTGGSLNFITNATEKMRITSTGYVGMGTNSPLTKLQLVEVGGPSVTPTLTLSQDGDLGLDWVAGAINFYSYDGSTNSKGGIGNIRVAAETAYNTGATPSYMAFYTHPNVANNNTTFGAATEKMRINAAGNVGIGTISPSYQLDVQNSSNPSLRVRNAALGGTSTLLLETANNFSGTCQAYVKCLGVVGNGTSTLTFGTAGSVSDTTATERMRIDYEGHVLIGLTSSIYSSSGRRALEINGTSNAIMALVINNSSTSGGYVYHGGSSMYLNNNVNGGTTFVISNNGGVYLSSGATSWTANSDERLKDITGDIDNAVDSLMTLRAVKHTWKADIEKVEKLALIAQDVEKVFPQVIDKGKLPSKPNEEQTDETEYLGVRYTELIPVLIKAIQELNQTIQNQQQQINQLINK